MRATIMGNVRTLVYKRLGVSVSGHLWRKILANILFKFSRDERAVEALLGHSPNSRATNAYVENMRTLAAAGALDDLFAEFVDQDGSKEGNN